MNNNLYRRKSGCGFVLRSGMKEIMIKNGENKPKTIKEYFMHVPEYCLSEVNKIAAVLYECKVFPVVKLVGSGTYAQIKMLAGCLARILISLMKDSNTIEETKEILSPNYDMCLSIAKSDTRIVERKKAGFKGARASPPSNKR